MPKSAGVVDPDEPVPGFEFVLLLPDSGRWLVVGGTFLMDILLELALVSPCGDGGLPTVIGDEPVRTPELVPPPPTRRSCPFEAVDPDVPPFGRRALPCRDL